jgi:YHS domain-containing protein
MAQSPPPAIQIPPGNPPLGLDGFCPIELTENKRWVVGDARWGLIHRDRTYLFAGPEQRNRFDAAPDRYAPVASGNDVVLMIEQGELTPGRREHGAWFEDRVYLFSSQETYLKFGAAPERYVSTLLQMSQQQNVARLPYGAPDLNRASPEPAASRDLSGRWR